MPTESIAEPGAEAQANYPGLPDVGYWRQWMHHTEAATDAPAPFRAAAGLASVSTALGQRAHIPQGDRRIYPHLWFMLTASSGIARKSTSCRSAPGALEAAELGHLLLPQTVAPETLIERLAAHPEGLIVWAEYAAASRAWAKSRNAEMPALLTDLYDAPPSLTKTRKDALGEPVTYTIRHPAVSILAASTPDYLTLTGEDAWGGYWARWLPVPAERDRPVDPWPEQTAVPEGLTGTLAALAGADPQAVPMPRTGSVWNDYLSLSHQATKHAEAGGPATGMYTRLPITAVKLALVLQAGIEGRVPEALSAEAVKAACALARWHAAAWLRWLGETDPAERLRGRIIQYLRRTKPNAGHLGIPLREIYRALHVDADRARDALSEMSQAGEVIYVAVSPPEYQLPPKEEAGK